MGSSQTRSLGSYKHSIMDGGGPYEALSLLEKLLAVNSSCEKEVIFFSNAAIGKLPLF